MFSMRIAFSILVLLLLFPQSSYSQSFEEKPYIPVFQVDGERVVRVDCWGLQESQKMQSLFLKTMDHPDIFSYMEGDTVIEVSLLKSEDTLHLMIKDPEIGSFEVSTYGLNLGYSLRGKQADCQIFTGELEDN